MTESWLLLCSFMRMLKLPVLVLLRFDSCSTHACYDLMVAPNHAPYDFYTERKAIQFCRVVRVKMASRAIHRAEKFEIRNDHVSASQRPWQSKSPTSARKKGACMSSRVVVPSAAYVPCRQSSLVVRSAKTAVIRCCIDHMKNMLQPALGFLLAVCYAVVR
jgi:hypothetical protein